MAVDSQYTIYRDGICLSREIRFAREHREINRRARDNELQQ